ncbi:unnamed protein product [Zymoseptoria tritici ST99CH_1A5]|uniref:Uncharacterized protein n=1 Tax=Zymoseptoria tritici ST99CH_1A5 TaxID=1276529 RepID=A0A1Y6LL80_ZYMTR|nr:unnamed protein product [Zymoseptoria tritici ST99CH_1A5]
MMKQMMEMQAKQMKDMQDNILLFMSAQAQPNYEGRPDHRRVPTADQNPTSNSVHQPDGTNFQGPGLGSHARPGQNAVPSAVNQPGQPGSSNFQGPGLSAYASAGQNAGTNAVNQPDSSNFRGPGLTAQERAAQVWPQAPLAYANGRPGPSARTTSYQTTKPPFVGDPNFPAGEHFYDEGIDLAPNASAMVTRGHFTPTQYQISSFRPDSIGFFDPHLDEDTYGKGPSVHYKGSTYFRDVFAFTGRLAITIETSQYSAETLRLCINRCLMGRAQDWFNWNLTEAHRA